MRFLNWGTLEEGEKEERGGGEREKEERVGREEEGEEREGVRGGEGSGERGKEYKSKDTNNRNGLTFTFTCNSSVGSHTQIGTELKQIMISHTL